MSGNENGTVQTDLEAFMASGDVEVGEDNLKSQQAKPAAVAPKTAPEIPANQGGEDDGAGEDDGNSDAGGEDDGAGEDEGGDDDSGKNGKRRRETPEGRLARIKRENAQLRNQLRSNEQMELTRLREENERLKNGGLPPVDPNATAVSKLGPAPDPMDQEKYPLGHLDAQYVEDRIEYVADLKLAKQSDAALQRQQENQRNTAQQQVQERIQTQIRDITDKGLDLYDDFQESVVDAGLKGLWKLEQATFEAAVEEDHGAQILYELAHNPEEAKKVAAMTPYRQGQYVAKRNAEIAEKQAQRKIPGAGAPPSTQARGSSSRTRINPATDNLDDFEKAWNQDAKKS